MADAKNVTEEVVEQQINVEDVQQEQVATIETYKNTIKKLIATGCKRINGVRIKNINFTEIVIIGNVFKRFNRRFTFQQRSDTFIKRGF